MAIDDSPSQPLLSVVTAVLNAPERLLVTRACIENACAMGAGCEIEHIIVDGASGAPTQRVLAGMRASGAVVISEPDTGIYQAVNKGIRRARGQHIWVLHAGDSCTPQMVAALHAHLAADLDGLAAVKYFDCRLGQKYIVAPEEISSAIGLYNLSISHQSLIVPCHVYQRIGLYREDFRIVSDHIWMRAAHQGGVAFRKLSGFCVEMDDAGLSSGRTSASRNLFQREIISRTKLYYPFLADTLCEQIVLARDSQAIREDLRHYLQSSHGPVSASPHTWLDFQRVALDYLAIFEQRGVR